MFVWVLNHYDCYVFLILKYKQITFPETMKSNNILIHVIDIWQKLLIGKARMLVYNYLSETKLNILPHLIRSNQIIFKLATRFMYLLEAS